MSEDKWSRLVIGKFQDLTAEACCVRKSTILHMCREAKKWKEEGTKKVFPSPRKKHKHSKKRAKLQRRPKKMFTQNWFRILWQRRIPYCKKVTLALKEKSCIQRFTSYFIQSCLCNNSVLFLCHPFWYQFANTSDAICTCTEQSGTAMATTYLFLPKPPKN
jgi:hypothetical protein